MSKLVVAILCLLLAVSLAQSVGAAESVKIPPGAKAQIKGKSAIIRGGGSGNIDGTYNCKCVSSSAQGECVASISGSSILCKKASGSKCGECGMLIQTGAGSKSMD